MVNLDDNFDDYSTYFDDQPSNVPMKQMDGGREAMMRFQGAFTPFMVRAPKVVMNPAAATFSNLAAAMMGLKEKKLRTSLQHFRKYEQSRNTALAEARRVADGYRNIMRKSYSNPYLMKTQLMQAARDYQDPLMINALQGQDPGAAYNRMTELSKLNDLVESEGGKLRDYYGKKVMGTRRMLKELIPEDLAIVDQINFDRGQRGEEPWSLEDYYYAKGVFKSPKQQEFPNEYQVYQLAQQDPEFAKFYQTGRYKPEATPNKIQEYEYAKQQGYQGTFMDYMKETKPGNEWDFENMPGQEAIPGTETQPPATQKKQMGMGEGILRGMAGVIPGGTNILDKFMPPSTQEQPQTQGIDEIFGSPEQPGVVEGTGGTGAGMDMGGFIKEQIQSGADPVQLFAELNRQYEETGDENMNPARYWELFGFKNLDEKSRKALLENTGTIRLGPGVE